MDCSQRDLLAEVEGKEIEPTSDYPLAEVENLRAEMREGLRDGTMSPQRVTCNQCGTELVRRRSGMTCNPPQIHVGCPGCGWIGYKVV